MNTPVRALFIGNSYTFFQQLWDRFAELSNAAGIPVLVDHVTKGGYHLYQHADPENEFGARVLEKLANNTYDIAFLQEQSNYPITNYDSFRESTITLQNLLQEHGIRVFLYQTWGRKEGHPLLEKYGWTPREMSIGLRDAYRKLGAELGIAVSPVGDAFLDVYEHHPELDLYNADLTHPSPAGTYLAALCHFATVFERTPLGIPYSYGVESEEEADLLRHAAARACGFEN